MVKNMEKINEFFASNNGAENVCLTSDGMLFKQENFSFAVAHAQRLNDPKIKVYGKNEKFKESKKNLFYDGSNFEFILIDEKKEDVPGKYDGLSLAELHDLAEELDGYKKKLNKAQLIELLTSNEEK